MKQVLLRGGKAVVEEVPAPMPGPGSVLVRIAWSCLSPGTELATAATTGVTGALQQVMNEPATLRKALHVLHNRGLGSFSALARERITLETCPGYSCSGTVLQAGHGVEGFAIGERVACAGDQYAKHAEIVSVPANLVARIPTGVDLVDASTVALGAIALQGVRRAQTSIGELVGVIGLGLLGQLTVQILKASGCRVFGIDTDPVRVDQAQLFGLEGTSNGKDSAAEAAYRFSEGRGLDAVIITAATKSDEPLYQSMQMARRKGRIVVVGDVGLGARREAMYSKELDLLISTSYGPGRYDQKYEVGGVDYPYAYVRWTENRNMQAYLDLVASGRVILGPLVKRRMAVSEANDAYRILREERPRPYTVVLEYPRGTEASVGRCQTVGRSLPIKSGTIALAILGAGSFTRGVHLPNLKRLGDRFRIEAIVTRHGPIAVATARQVGARAAGTDYSEVLSDPMIDAVLIATRHHLHAKMVEAALRAGKHVFVEKPLAITEEELDNLSQIVNALHSSTSGCPAVFVGFNRRYSPYAVRLRDLIAQRSTPLHVSYRMNAGYLPPEHWTHGPEGGGRALGEACHILDLFRFLTGASAVEIRATGLRSTRLDVAPTDNFSATIRYADGSVCTLLYTAQGGKEFPKEALEMHFDGRSFIVDDYKNLVSFGASANFRTRTQEKGHYEELLAFHKAICGEMDRNALWNDAVEVSQIAFEVDRQLRGQPPLSARERVKANDELSSAVE